MNLSFIKFSDTFISWYFPDWLLILFVSFCHCTFAFNYFHFIFVLFDAVCGDFWEYLFGFSFARRPRNYIYNKNRFCTVYKKNQLKQSTHLMQCQTKLIWYTITESWPSIELQSDCIKQAQMFASTLTTNFRLVYTYEIARHILNVQGMNVYWWGFFVWFFSCWYL